MILRFISVLAYTAGESFVWYKILPAKYEKQVTMSALILLAFCSSMQSEFFATERISAFLLLLAQIAVQLFLFKDNLSRTHIVVFAGGLLSALLTIIYGGVAGSLYRLAMGENTPLWISGENLNLAGLLLLLPYILLWVILCLRFLPRVQKQLKKWSLRRCKIVFGLTLIFDVCMSAGFGIEDQTDMREYAVLYSVLFFLLVLLAGILAFYLFKGIQKNMQQNRNQERILQQQYQQYKELEAVQQDLRELRHDLKNHLASGAVGGGYTRKRFSATVRKYRRNWRIDHEFHNNQDFIYGLYDCYTGFTWIYCI